MIKTYKEMNNKIVGILRQKILIRSGQVMQSLEILPDEKPTPIYVSLYAAQRIEELEEAVNEWREILLDATIQACTRSDTGTLNHCAHGTWKYIFQRLEKEKMIEKIEGSDDYRRVNKDED